MGAASRPAPARKAAARLPQRPGKKGAALERLAQEAADAFNRGDITVALDKAQRVVTKNPRHAKAWAVIAAVHWQRQDLAQAEHAARQVLNNDPNNRDGLALLASVLRRAGRFEESESIYRRALSLFPKDAQLHSNYSTLLLDLGKEEAAEKSAFHAVELEPDNSIYWSNYGNSLARNEKIEEAINALQKALDIDQNNVFAYLHLAAAYRKQDNFDSAQKAFLKAESIRGRFGDLSEHYIPNYLAYRLSLPKIMDSTAAITHWRRRYQEGIATLQTELDEIRDLSQVSAVSFYLAYHDADDRPIMKALCRLFCSKAPQLNYTAPHIARWQMPENRRIRVGFCSQFLVSHTIGKLYQGLLRGLDRRRFEVALIYPPQAKRDAIRSTLEASADRVITLTGKLPQWQSQVAALELDALFYPDIGMAPSTYFLAYARLAPVQFVSYGHPDTTGIDTLDYFLGGDAPLEATGAEAHYSERLIRCPRLPFCYQLFAVPKEIPTRAELGLPENGALYGCPQSLFKLHPDFDAALAAIAAGDPDGHIVLIDGKVKTWNDRLRQRWAKSAPILNDRVRFVPRVPLDRFMGLMAHFDVVLDPIHFGSGNTLYEGMAYGKPIVTWPGCFARGRFVAAAYHQMGIEAIAPLAATIEDYAAIALAFGRDAERRAAFQQAALAAAKARLYGDTQTTRQLETFLLAALEAAARGEKLPSGWRAPTGMTLEAR